MDQTRWQNSVTSWEHPIRDLRMQKCNDSQWSIWRKSTSPLSVESDLAWYFYPPSVHTLHCLYIMYLCRFLRCLSKRLLNSQLLFAGGRTQNAALCNQMQTVHSLSLSRKFRSATTLPYMHINTLRLLRIVINWNRRNNNLGIRQTCCFRFNFVIMWLTNHQCIPWAWGPGWPAARAVSYIHSYIHRVARYNPSDSHIISYVGGMGSWNETTQLHWAM